MGCLGLHSQIHQRATIQAGQWAAAMRRSISTNTGKELGVSLESLHHLQTLTGVVCTQAACQAKVSDADDAHLGQTRICKLDSDWNGIPDKLVPKPQPAENRHWGMESYTLVCKAIDPPLHAPPHRRCCPALAFQIAMANLKEIVGRACSAT